MENLAVQLPDRLAEAAFHGSDSSGSIRGDGWGAEDLIGQQLLKVREGASDQIPYPLHYQGVRSFITLH